LAWTDPIGIWTVALALADRRMAGRGLQLKNLEALMEDWRPNGTAPPRDGPAVPLHGLSLLAQAISAIAPMYPAGKAGAAADLVQRMYEVNASYSTADPSEDPLKAYTKWRVVQSRLLDQFASHVSDQLRLGTARTLDRQRRETAKFPPRHARKHG